MQKEFREAPPPAPPSINPMRAVMMMLVAELGARVRVLEEGPTLSLGESRLQEIESMAGLIEA